MFQKAEDRVLNECMELPVNAHALEVFSILSSSVFASMAAAGVGPDDLPLKAPGNTIQINTIQYNTETWLLNRRAI